MHMTHNSLRGLTLHARPPGPVFAGERATLELVVTNPGAARHGLGFGVQARPAALAFVEIAAAGQSPVTVGVLAERRGLHPLPMLRVETRFPFGLFRAWSLWRPAGQLCVYPQPEQPAAALPAAGAVAGGPVQAKAASGGEFDGLRPWRRGDSLRQVAGRRSPQRRADQPREARIGPPRAVARLGRGAPAGHRGAPVPPRGLGAGGRAPGPGLWPAPAGLGAGTGRWGHAPPRRAERAGHWS
jgi:hypothetical protein